MAVVFPDMTAGIEAGRLLLQQAVSPLGVRVLDSRSAESLDCLTGIESGQGLLLAFYAGRPSAVARRIDESADLLTKQGANDISRLGQTPGAALLRRLTDLGWTHETLPTLGIKLSVSPVATSQVAAGCQVIRTLGPTPSIIADPGTGQIRAMWRDDADQDTIPQVIDDIRQLARRANGSAVVEQCPLAVKKGIDVWGDPPEGMAIMRSLKKKFDPSGILNRGRFVGRI